LQHVESPGQDAAGVAIPRQAPERPGRFQLLKPGTYVIAAVGVTEPVSGRRIPDQLPFRGLARTLGWQVAERPASPLKRRSKADAEPGFEQAFVQPREFNLDVPAGVQPGPPA
jgi:hypothetical protein